MWDNLLHNSHYLFRDLLIRGHNEHWLKIMHICQHPSNTVRRHLDEFVSGKFIAGNDIKFGATEFYCKILAKVYQWNHCFFLFQLSDE